MPATIASLSSGFAFMYSLDRAATLAAAAVDQVPASAGARQVLGEARALLTEARLSEANRATVERLIRDGRAAFREGRYGESTTLFEGALELDPSNELAASYLDLARERGRGSSRRTSARPTPRPQPTRVAATAPQGPAPTPGNARITVSFSSPIQNGMIVVTLDGSTLAEIPFEFDTKGFLGFRKKGSGLVKKVLLAPSGRHTIGATLSDGAGAVIGSASFERQLLTGTDWTLRFDLPAKDARANVYLVKAGGQ